MKRSARGFTLLEVMVALAILAVSLVAILGINGGTVRSHAYAKRLTVATMLARSKMIDLETHFHQEGFTSDFDQTMEGDFSEEGWQDFRWKAEIVVPKLDAGQTTALVQQLAAQLLGDIGGGGGGGGNDPAYDTRTMLGPYQGIIEGQISTIVETMKKSLREIRLQVSWMDGRREETLDVVTHMVILGGTPQQPSGGGPP